MMNVAAAFSVHDVFPSCGSFSFFSASLCAVQLLLVLLVVLDSPLPVVVLAFFRLGLSLVAPPGVLLSFFLSVRATVSHLSLLHMSASFGASL